MPSKEPRPRPVTPTRRIVKLNGMRLDLSDDEARELGSALEAQLHTLRFELSAADAREYKHELRARLERLERVAARLASEAEQVPAPL